VIDTLRAIVLEAYDRYIGLELSEVAVDCCITKAPCGGQKAGRSPVDRGKQGTTRSTAVDAKGIPIGSLSAPANRHDSPLLVPTLEHACASVGVSLDGTSVYLDRGYDSELNGGPHDLVHPLLGPNELKGLRDRRSAEFVFADPLEQGAAIVGHGGDIDGQVLGLALGREDLLRIEGCGFDQVSGLDGRYDLLL
jgi:hypothetical protein